MELRTICSYNINRQQVVEEMERIFEATAPERPTPLVFKGGHWRDEKGRFVSKAEVEAAGLNWNMAELPLQKAPPLPIPQAQAVPKPPPAALIELRQAQLTPIPQSPPVTKTTPVTAVELRRRAVQVACPKCKAAPMSKTPAHRGGMFWGCPRYPMCKGSRGLDEGYAHLTAAANYNQAAREMERDI